MATLRKRGDKWQVQIRRSGRSPIARTFTLKSDAEAVRQCLPVDVLELKQTAMGELLVRYRDTVIDSRAK